MAFLALLSAAILSLPPRLGAVEREAIDPEFFGKLPHQVFDENDIGVTPRVLDLELDQNGFLYGAGQNGILRFDGSHWIKLAGIDGLVSEISINDEGIIFFRGFNRFGCLRPSGADGYTLTDLSERLADKEPRSLSALHSIVVSKDEIYFLSNDLVFVYQTEADRLSAVPAPRPISSNGALFNGSLVVGMENGTLGRLGENGLETAYPKTESGHGRAIVHLSQMSDGSLMGIAEDGRLFSYRGKGPEIHSRLSNFDPRSTIKIIELQDGSLIIVDAHDITHYSARMEQRYRSLDLVVSDFPAYARDAIRTSDFKSLWIALDAQLVRMDMDSPTHRLSQSHGIDAQVKRMLRHKGALYLGTSRQVLTQFDQPDKETNGFRPIRGSSVQASQLITSCADGVLILADGELMVHQGGSEQPLITPSEAANARGSLPYRGPSRFATLGRSSVSIFERRNNLWQSEPVVVELDLAIMEVHNTKSGEIWVEKRYGGIYRIDNDDGAYRSKLYGIEHGLPNTRARFVEVQGRELVIAGQQAFALDTASDRFESVERLDPIFDDIPGIRRLWNDHLGRLWALTRDSAGLVRQSNYGRHFLDTAPLERFKDQSPKLLLLEDSGKMWFSSSAGLLLCDANRVTDETDSFRTIISRIERIGAEETLHDFAIAPASTLKLSSSASLRFYFTTSLGASPPGLQFRYRLDPSLPWSPWKAEDVVEIANIEQGNYAFEAESRLDLNPSSHRARLELAVAQPIQESPFAYALYATILLALIGAASLLWTVRYRKRSRELEAQVRIRTKELEEKTQRLSAALDELTETQSKLMDSARTAGMAEVATSVLHNVGNVMNSLSIAVGVLNNKLQKSKLDSFDKAVGLISRNKDNLADFLINDARGSRLPEYMENLNKVLQEERAFYNEELNSITEHLQHATSIIASQQRTARNANLFQEFNLREAIENALRISVSERWRKRIDISVDAPADIDLQQDQHVLLQALTNFIKNAAESIMDAKREKGRIDVLARRLPDQDSVEIIVTDDGVGIDPSASAKIFTMGYTTKSYGHGFGMHAAANAVSVVGGRISLTSEGLGKGATARLVLPITAPKFRRSKETASSS